MPIMASVVAILIASMPADAAQPRLRYAPLAPGTTVTQRGLPVTGPQIAYPALPLDDRVAPNDFAMDEDATEPLTAEQARDVASQLALAQLSQNYRPNPAIWKIADRDTTIYLFGTIHVLPPGFEWRTAALDRIVARADTLLVESIDTGPGLGGLLAGSATDDGLPPIASRVDAAHRAKLAAFTASLPPGAAAIFDRMPSWLAATAIAYVRDVRAGELPGPGADDWLEARFRARGRPIAPIENGANVLASVDAIPQSAQSAMLSAALDAPLRSRAEMRAPLHAWAKGDVGPDSLLTVDLVSTTGSSALAGPLITQRNKAWTTALIKRLRKPGIVLFAAGAGHFIGSGSVIEQLEKRRVHVSRVQ